jgi:hypothetical protein
MAFLIGSLMERAGKTLVVKINDHPFPEIFRFLGNYKRECSGGFVSGFGVMGLVGICTNRSFV